MKTIEQKIKTIENLPGCGWRIRGEALIAAEALKIERERHAQALRDIEERFQLDAWRHVEKNWKPGELEAA
jgi:hypothetical protein